MNRVKELRLLSGMQQKEIAAAVGVSRPTVSEWEHQKKDPKGDRLMRLADLFDVPPAYIIRAYDQGTEHEQAIKSAITDDERTLLERYRALSDEDKELLRSDALRMMREAERGTGNNSQRTAG